MQTFRLDTNNVTTNADILIVAAVPMERDAIKRGITNSHKIDVHAIGVGPISAAVNTAKIMAQAKYRLVIIAGIGGGFTSKAQIGDLVIADKLIAADLGAETPEGFLPLDEMNLGQTHLPVEPDLLHKVKELLSLSGVPVVTAPILTLSTVTGTAETAEKLACRFPNAASEAMEGFAVATAAQSFHIPFLGLRAISNLVGPRDRNSWRIQEALDVLTSASTLLASHSEKLIENR